MDEGTTVEAYLRNVLVGADELGMGILDLRGATIVDGTISAASFEVGKHNKHNSSVMIDADSGLQRLEVLGTLGIGQCAAGSARFGDPDTLDESGNWMLPPNVDITVGVNDAVRGNVYVGKSTLAGCYGALIASSGGSFQAYLNDLEVGTKAEGAGYSQDLSAWLDLSSMSSFFLDAARIKIGTATLTTASGSQAIVRFPAGTAVIATLEVGHPSFADNCSAALELNNTEVDVFTSVHVYDKGTVTVHVGATPCGLDLDTAATLAIDDGGKIEIIFDTEPSGTETHWGLRWAGNHAGILQPLADAGKLTWDTYAVSGPAGIVFKDGFTYVALVEEQGLVAIARDLTVEFLPPDFPSVTISVDMIDSGSNDPRGHAIVSRAISSPSDTVPGDELVTLGWAGDHTVTLTVTNNNVPPDVATVDCTVVVVDASASSRETGAVVWSGGDPIGRRQWIWGANWIGGNAPANPTQADVFFMLDGSSTDETITNELEDDWAVGKLRFRTPEGSTATNIRHTTDLAGYTLTAGHLWISQYGGGGNLGNGGSVGVTINNGTLQIGSEQAKGDLLVSNAVWYNAAAELIFGTGVTLRPYLRNMYVGENADQAPAGEAAIDFGSASIENNELKAENVRISTGKRTAAIKLYAGNQVERIEVSGSLKIGDGAAASGRFGDPALTDVDGNWKLAPNTHVRVGTDENTRGELIIGRSTLAGAYGALVMSEGGSFNAYLTDLQVGTKLASSGYWQSRHAFLDLRSVASFSLDAQNVKIGPAAAVKSDAARAEVRLPAGLAKVSNLQVGHPSTANNCSALLQLAGTTTQVSGQTDVGDSGTILIEVGGTSSGLDLAAGAGLTVQDGALPANNGKIRIVFSTPSASGLYWGLRWEGDHAADLQALADVGKLTWDDTALPGGASIFTQGGFTMLGAAVNTARVNSFIVSDRTSGSALITNEAAVAVAITGEPAEGAAIDGYAVNESGVEPAAGDWQSSLASYTIQAPSGSNVTLYAWVKDTAGNVASKSAAIHYNSAVPVVSAIEIADNGDGTATATWATDILAEGSLRYGPVALSGATPNEIKESALGTEHSATFAFAAATNCKLVLANTEAASAPIYWPNPWPIDGDSNMDCRVNILDLIFIRNKLNLDVNSGDNWKADVNQDTRINILNLIFVRNKLNTQCP